MKSLTMVTNIMLLALLGCTSGVAPSTHNPAYAAWGDSFTNDTQLSVEQRYPARLSALLGRTVYNDGVAGETSTQVAARVLADTKKAPAIFWMGHNDEMTPDVIRSDVRQAVQSLGGKNFIVLSLINGDYQPEGSEGYALVLRINEQFRADYPANYLDVRTPLAKGANADIPDMRRDARHLNAAGYDSVARMVANFVEQKGW